MKYRYFNGIVNALYVTVLGEKINAVK